MATWTNWGRKMVTVKVFFEGGNDNDNPDIVENTARLRESFNKLLNADFENEQVRIEAIPSYSVHQTVKIRIANSLLLIDLDTDKNKRSERILKSQLTDIQENVFFMIQSMEAWILSQPEVIEQVFAYFKVGTDSVKDDSQLQNKHPEAIIHPDRVLDTIFQRYFSIGGFKL